MTRHRLPWSGLVAAALAAVAFPLAISLHTGSQGPADSAAAGPVSQIRDDPAPPLAGRTTAGTDIDLSALRGQIVLVNVWASWCAPCRQELPLLAEAARAWAGQGVRLIGLDVRDDENQARELLTAVGAAGLTVIPDPDGSTAVSWGVRGVPETFVVDRAGRIRARAQGAVTADWLGQQVNRLVGA
jgi:cytochrome c biogenesis protein CcmG, thiol:disulfide interchange protein DsbE